MTIVYPCIHIFTLLTGKVEKVTKDGCKVLKLKDVKHGDAPQVNILSSLHNNAINPPISIES